MYNQPVNKVEIIKRRLTDYEIDKLICDIKFYPDLTYVSKNHWKRIKTLLVLEEEHQFAGVCAVYEFRGWIKIGPLVLLNDFHGKGYGKLLVSKVLNSYHDKNIFAASTNPIVKSLLLKLHFANIDSFMSIPFEVKLFLFKQMIEYFNIPLVSEAIRKRITTKRGAFSYYIKYSN